ncbi:MAG: hypothetical protein H6971_04435 [Gammaproteobacteria bacterium]|nr:hypothetical protein [Gammaproteobacteria bacterium]
METTPSRVLLHNLVARIRESLLQLEPNLAQDTSGGKEVPASVKPVMEHLELLSKALIRITEFGFPLDLNLASSDIPSLLHEIPFRFQDELARRAISFEITLAPEVGAAVVDRFKLREAIGALMRYALASLPERGGNLGLRSSIVLPDGTESKELLIEVADNGHGHDPQWFETMVDTSPSSEMEGAALSRTDLSLAKGIIERHGGRLQIRNVIGEGTFAQIALPLRE